MLNRRTFFAWTAVPELGIGEGLLGLHHALAALLWAGAFGAWLQAFLPYFLAPGIQAAAR